MADKHEERARQWLKSRLLPHDTTALALAEQFREVEREVALECARVCDEQHNLRHMACLAAIVKAGDALHELAHYDEMQAARAAWVAAAKGSERA